MANGDASPNEPGNQPTDDIPPPEPPPPTGSRPVQGFDPEPDPGAGAAPPPKPKGPQDWLEDEDEVDPENEQQSLFWLGWMARDVPSSVRWAARREYNEKYGPLTNEDWKKWKEKMGYGETA